MYIKTKSTLAIIIPIILLTQYFWINSTLAKQPIAPPFIDSDLTEFHHKLDHYENILGYKNDEYLLLYGNEKTWLFDMNGKQYREWDTNFKRGQLLKNCNLMVLDNNQHEYIEEKNFAGEVVWSYQTPGIAHHDFEIIDTSNGEEITLLYRKPLPPEVQIDNLCRNEEVSADAVLQIDRNGNKLYEWAFHDHYIKLLNTEKCTDSRRELMKTNRYSNLLDWIHPNAINVIKDNHWYKKGYSEFKPGNIIVTAHYFNRIIIIEKETNRVVWIYKGDELPLDLPHEAKMIPEGLPGAGNILIYDNGAQRKYSRIIEINPITKKTIWSYLKPGEFFNKWAGSQQRLKNGDTFISDDGSGRAFIINKKGEIKWQFVNPNMSYIWVKRAHLYSRKDFAHCLPKESN